MTVNKTATRIDQSITFEAAPILGATALTSFTDSITGETGTRYFEKYFQYSLDGVNFSKTQPLTNGNLAAITFDTYSILVIRLMYIRKGSDATGNLTVNTWTLSGTFTPLDNTKYFYYNKSIFTQFFQPNDAIVLTWAVNVLQKMYYPGVVPKYIERGKNQNENGEDDDYIAFWFSVTHYLSYLVNYGRVFENFDQYRKVLIEYLKQQGMLFCEDEITMPDLQTLMKNFYREIAERGTESIIKIKGQDNAEVDGELRRLICWDNTDEFSFGLVPRHQIGWNIGNSSPLYKRNQSNYFSNKSYEKTKDFNDLSVYPKTGTNLSILTEGDKKVLQIGLNSGIGAADPTKAIPIDSNLNYTIEFRVSQAALSNNLNFGLIGYDENDVALSFESIQLGAPNTDYFVQGGNLNIANKYYTIRGILYNKNHVKMSAQNSRLNLGFGQNLRCPASCVKIVPWINNTVASNIKIWDLQVRVSSLNSSLGFIQTNHLMTGYLKNNNHKYNFDQVTNLIREFLIPYNSWLKLFDVSNPPETPPIEEFYWVPADPACQLTPLLWEGSDPYCETETWEGIDPYCIQD